MSCLGSTRYRYAEGSRLKRNLGNIGNTSGGEDPLHEYRGGRCTDMLPSPTNQRDHPLSCSQVILSSLGMLFGSKCSRCGFLQQALMISISHSPQVCSVLRHSTPNMATCKPFYAMPVTPTVAVVVATGTGLVGSRPRQSMHH